MFWSIPFLYGLPNNTEISFLSHYISDLEYNYDTDVFRFFFVNSDGAVVFFSFMDLYICIYPGVISPLLYQNQVMD